MYKEDAIPGTGGRQGDWIDKLRNYTGNQLKCQGDPPAAE